jgi:hypothetical protein
MPNSGRPDSGAHPGMTKLKVSKDKLMNILPANMRFGAGEIAKMTVVRSERLLQLAVIPGRAFSARTRNPEVIHYVCIPGSAASAAAPE